MLIPRGMPMAIALSVFLTSMLIPTANAGIILSWLPASDYNSNTATMYSTLGIAGDTIDNFETQTLIPGLTITLSGGVTTTTWTSLPNLLNQTVCGSLSIGAWDGTDFVSNAINNQLNSCTSPTNLATLTTFNYAPGTTLFGIALSNFQSLNSPSFPITNHELFVNGQDLGTIENLDSSWTPGIVRNGYLIVTATGGSSITSVGFENLTSTDFLGFDTLAVAAQGAPEPGSVWLLMAGSGLICLRKSRARRTSSRRR